MLDAIREVSTWGAPALIALAVMAFFFEWVTPGSRTRKAEEERDACMKARLEDAREQTMVAAAFLKSQRGE
jgi:hypothetical protein